MTPSPSHDDSDFVANTVQHGTAPLDIDLQEQIMMEGLVGR